MPADLSGVKLRLAKMHADAADSVLKDAEWLTVGQIAELTGSTTSDVNARFAEWTKARKIFAIDTKEVSELYPRYALDSEKHYAPYPVIAEVIKAFGFARDGWGLAFWFSSTSNRLGGLRRVSS